LLVKPKPGQTVITIAVTPDQQRMLPIPENTMVQKPLYHRIKLEFGTIRLRGINLVYNAWNVTEGLEHMEHESSNPGMKRYFRRSVIPSNPFMQFNQAEWFIDDSIGRLFFSNVIQSDGIQNPFLKKIASDFLEEQGFKNIPEKCHKCFLSVSVSKVPGPHSKLCDACPRKEECEEERKKRNENKDHGKADDPV